jgi:pimeloyl-ACP methyl ester carboxylesterase
VKVSIGDVRLWFDVLNAGLVPEGPVMREKPVLLALHGGPGFDHTDFKGVLDPLCDVVQVVMYDHRGNGRSDDGDPELWNLPRWGDDVRAFCAALGIERPFVLGWSFGGMVAQSYAARYPDEIAGLVLLSTAAQISEEQFGPAFERLGGAEARDIAHRFLVELDPAAEEEFMRVCFPFYTVKRDPEHLSYGETRPVIRPEVTRHFFSDEAWSMDLRPSLPRITCPTLILNGVHDPITPPVCSDEMEAGLVSAPVTRVLGERSSHDLPEDEPELFEGALRAFLKTCLESDAVAGA